MENRGNCGNIYPMKNWGNSNLMLKNSSVFLQEFCNEKWALPCHAFLGGPACLTKFPKLVFTRNRPDIRLNPVPAGYPASKSGSGPVFEKICRIFAGYFFLEKWFPEKL